MSLFKKPVDDPRIKRGSEIKPKSQPMAKKETKPVKTIGPLGSGNGSFIEVAIWENEITVDGDRQVNVHAVSFSRNYREKDDWKKTKTLRTQDIPVLKYALDQAYDWLMSQNS